MARLAMLWLSLCSVKCQTPPVADSDVHAQTFAVVGGSVSRGFAATGALRVRTRLGTSGCTATLVTPTLILTAGHCVDEPGITGGDMQPGTVVTFILGQDVNRPSLSRRVTQVTVHPGYRPAVSRVGTDLAVAELEAPIDEVEPVSVSFASVDTLIGERATVVGYGLASGAEQPAGPRVEAQADVRRSVDVVIADRDATHWFYEVDVGRAGACNGDSGGPAFVMVDDRAYQVGVVSYGDEACAYRGAYVRMDAAAAWLQGQGVPVKPPPPPSCTRDGRCEGGCSQDEDCEQLLCPPGVCEPNAAGCVAATATIAGLSCHYVSVDGQVCASTPLVQIDMDEDSGQCVFSDLLGRVCGTRCVGCSSAGLCQCRMPSDDRPLAELVKPVGDMP